MTIYFYGRCSADENFDKGSSIDTQLSKCVAYGVIKNLMQLMRKKGKSYQKVANEITVSTRKKFPVSWVHKILMREGVSA